MSKSRPVAICSPAHRGLSHATKRLILAARDVLKKLHPMTLRQLHYALFSLALAQLNYQNTKSDYQRLSRVTTLARRLYRDWQLAGEDGDPPAFGIPGAWIVDETRLAERVNLWEDAAAYADSVRRCYRRDLWQDQPTHIEIWAEKGTILGSIRPVLDRYGVTARCCHGFGSTGMETDIADDFQGLEKEIVVLYLGDHDPSGHVIESDMHRRVQKASGRTFQMTRLAIHREDIRKFKLPPQRIKTTDSRAASFRQRFGKDAATVELDALPPDELRRRITDAIVQRIQFETWNRQVAIQEVELKCIQDFGERLKNLPQARPEART